jgi:hypothetical protein
MSLGAGERGRHDYETVLAASVGLLIISSVLDLGGVPEKNLLLVLGGADVPFL